MSRSLVGSSSSSTFGSPISRRISCRRRRSPPERSRTSVRAFAPRKPKRSQSIPAVISWPSPSTARPRTSSSDSSTRRWPGISAVSCERWARRTVAPRSTAPVAGSSSPASSLISVVLPEPLTPTSADAVARAQAPGHVARARACRRTRRDTSTASSTLSPSRAVAKRSSSTRSRTSGSSAISSLAASMRNFGFDVRAGGPRRSHASSLRSSWLAAVLAGGGLAVALGAREHVGRVAALVLVDLAVGDLPGRGAHGVEEPAVVGHDEHRPAARGEVAREPVDALDVEVVGRLVEQQQLGGVEQQPRERDAPPLAARQRRDRGVEPGGEAAQRDAAEQAVEHAAKRGVAGPLVVGARADELVADRAGGRRARRPGPSSARSSAADARDRAGVGLLAAGDQAQQRRLAVAVAARRRRCGRPRRRRA